MRVAIIGSGPSGFYAAEALLRRPGNPVDVDMFDRLPTPYGLVRGGVAPDHQKIKTVTRVFASTASRPTFRFLGNVRLGTDLTVEDLRQHYHQIIYATGNEGDRRLGVPNEGIPGCTPASVFVGWYNGHPDYRQARFDFSVERAAVVGNGNVAMDVARILARTRTELERTDIAAHALEALVQSRVREIHVLGRRGPAQAAFTAGELHELGEMEDADPVVDPAELASLPADAKGEVIDLLRSYAARAPRPGTRRIHLRFLLSPTRIDAGPGGQVESITLVRNRLEVGEDGSVSARGTGVIEVLPVGLVVPAVGYAANPIPGVPHDPRARVIANVDGRVVDAATRVVVPNEYVVGWARSGPQGLIGEHKRASAHVVGHMTADGGAVASRPLPPREAIDELLRTRGVTAVTFDDWRRLDEVEVARGARRGAPRDKIVDVEAMLAVLGQER